MRKTLLTGLLLLIPSFALAQGAAPKPADPAKPAESKAGEAKPEEKSPEGPKPAEAPPEPSAAGPAGPGAATDAAASTNAAGEVGATATATTSTAAPAATPPESGSTTGPPSPVTRRGQESGDEDAWKFSYSGYLRAPMRVGLGKRLRDDTNGFTVTGASETTLHEPVIPDDQYLSFQSTAHNKRSWAEGFFSYGNAWASGTIGIMAYNLTEAGFNDVDAQWGISQAYVTITPDLGYENFRLWWKAGAIVDKYGMAGRYDAGEYDMYMFGRTHVMGETLHLDYDLDDAWTLYFEKGLGTKKPDPSQYNNARFTMLAHAHTGVKQGRNMEFGLHAMQAWSQEEFRPYDSTQGSGASFSRNGLPDGKLWTAGVEGRAELGAFGYIYGAYSHVGADYAVSVSRALEVLHASGGGEFTLGVVNNYLESPGCANAPGTSGLVPTAMRPTNWTALDPDGCSDGNGYLNALQVHYEFSLTNFQQQIEGGQRFWGEGFDAILKLYGLLVLVGSDARDTTGARTLPDLQSSTDPYRVTKLKYGADVLVQALSFLSPGLRFDRVEPNNHFPEQSFSIISPRLEFKSKWVTHERITLQYSRYLYDQRECAAPALTGAGADILRTFRCTQPPSAPVPYDGFGSTPQTQDIGQRAVGSRRPDQNVFNISATMWW